MTKTFIVRSQEVLDNTETDWREHGLYPLTTEGQFPANNAHTVTRVSPDELVVVNTEGDVLTFKVKR